LYWFLKEKIHYGELAGPSVVAGRALGFLDYTNFLGIGQG
jgi:hypothetical protein